MGVSRPSLREAIATLHDRGLLESRAGSGVYISNDLLARFSPALTQLFSNHEEALFDFIDFRTDIEGLAAERAARSGSDMDLQLVDSMFQKMVAAHDADDTELSAEHDAAFHLAIVEASHNVVMIHMMRSMFELLREGVFFNRQMMFRRRTTQDALLEQHRAINEGIQGRLPYQARAAMVAHLGYVRTALTAQREVERNETVARLRFEHETTR